jgi:hypothetical protein
MQGLIPSTPRITDWLASGETGIDKKPILKSGDWTPFLPREEKQYLEYTNNNFDTSACTAFSTLSCIETQLNALDWGEVGRKLHNLGVTDNLSDRYLAILSGTTKVGVTFQKAFDTLLMWGVLPEQDLPFGGAKWEEYMAFSNIKGEMLEKSQEIKKLMDIKYQHVYRPDQPHLGLNDKDKMFEWLKVSPLLAALKRGDGSHAVMIVSKDFYFDSYPPFVKPLAGETIQYAYSLVARPKVAVKPKYPRFTFTRIVPFGSRSASVVALQDCLIAYGTLTSGLNTGFFGNLTLQALNNFQLRNGLKVTGVVDAATRRVLNSYCSR